MNEEARAFFNSSFITPRSSFPLTKEKTEDEAKRFGALGRRNQGRARHGLDRERRALGGAVLFLDALRGGQGDEPRRVDRGGARGLLLDGALEAARRRRQRPRASTRTRR